MKQIQLTADIDRVGIEKSKIYGLIKERKIPEQIKICGASAWLDSEIEVWIQTHVTGAALLQKFQVQHDESANDDLINGRAELEEVLNDVSFSLVLAFSNGHATNSQLLNAGIEIEPIFCSPPRRRPAYIVIYKGNEYTIEV